MNDPLLLTHVAATLFMTGLIWFVQIVHYPLFASVTPGGFARYEHRHTARTTVVVAPVMLIEAATATLLLLGALNQSESLLLPSIGLALLVLIWLSTAFLQVPCHNKLKDCADPATITRLVRTNWVRTGAWSARSVIALLVLTSTEPI